MKTLDVTAYGGVEVLQVVDRDDPPPVEGRVRVRMHAAAVNPADCRIRQGLMAARTPDLQLPFVLGFDVAGVLLDGAAGLVEGQRVVGMIPWFADPGHGSNAQVVTVDPTWLAPLPDQVAWEIAGSFPLNSLTASQALELGALEPGQTLFVTGASGAVGAFAVQLATAHGVRVLATASAGDEDFVAGLGAQVITRTEAASMLTAVKEFAAEGVDALFDAAAIGGPILPAVKDGGAFVAPAAPAAPPTERGVQVSAVQSRPDAALLARLAGEIAAGSLVSRVADFVPLDQARSAHEQTQAGGLRGKLVLDLSHGR
ncbi:NADP-dependent oxidoreductase [Streptomyces sp. SID13031]|uniref:NADP-dependent oxidoreductase n=1 Tax=Streptomyces sp. SID13031 TaxID=2706046 RepID=UPI0013C6D178|nr:NADP-dependent oxidoreductase [Streptomyces sp. SID13031]NEA31326.1 NADP-dependent oxidoreductase [Streptomyces sp. SID13031]